MIANNPTAKYNTTSNIPELRAEKTFITEIRETPKNSPAAPPSSETYCCEVMSARSL